MAVIMAIGAHIGDMELTAGGVLAKEASKGNLIVLVALTAGEKGNPPGINSHDYRLQKIREAEEGAALLGGKSIVLDIADGMINADNETAWRVCDIIREERPDILITHWEQSVHKDHMACHKVVRHARFYAANSGFERARAAHPCSKLFFTENLEDKVGFQPFVYVDITDSYELWKKLVMTHEFTTKSTDHRYWEYYDALSICRGEESKYHRAETFMVRSEFAHVKLDSISRWE